MAPTSVAATTTTTRSTTTTATPTTTTTAPTTTSTAAAATTTTHAPGSLLQRRDPPPAAVAAQLDVHEGGNGGEGACREAFGPGPEVVPQGWYEGGVDVVPLSGALFFCLPGFDPALPIVMSTDSPSGVRFTEEEPSLDEKNLLAIDSEHGANFYFWYPFPTDELGSYSIEAQQGDRAAATTFEVVDAEHATSDARPFIGPAGTEFRIGVAGFAPLDEVELHIYWIDPEDPGTYVYFDGTTFAGDYSYVTSIRVATDRSGRGSYAIATSLADPTGSYGLIVEPPPEGSMSWFDWDAEFIVERTD